MKQSKAQTFNDGVVKIYAVDNIAAPGDKPKEGLTLKHTLRFDERTVGMNRFYAALQNNVKVDMVVRTQWLADVSIQDVAVVNDVQYKVRQVQYPSDITPPCMDLSLERLMQKYDLA